MDQKNKPEQTSEIKDDFAKRRKVIKGLVSSPVLMTLANNAEADVSAHQCLTNQTPGVEPACTATPGTPIPGWASAPVDMDNNDGTGTTVNSIAGTDGQCVAYGTESTPGTLTIEGYRPGGSVTLINQDGSPTGINAADANPITASCLASFT